MKARRQLASWIDTGVLAVQITTACISASVVWGQGLVGDKGLEAFMHHGVAVLLLAAARGRSRTELEAIVRDTQALLARELGGSAVQDDESQNSKVT